MITSSVAFCLRATVLVLLLVSPFRVAGCQTAEHTAQPGRGATLRYALTLEPGTLDPHMGNGLDTVEMLQNVFEGLVQFDAKTHIAPQLADRWEISPDGRTYTFHLNPKAKFHVPYARYVTAEDVKYSL